MAYTIKLNYQKHTDTIMWIGRDTRGLYRWIAYGRTYEDIWTATIDGRVNHYDDEEAFILAKTGKTINDFYDADGELLLEAYEDALWSTEVADSDFKDLLLSCTGNAYYQEFAYWNGEEWVGEED